jgi:hypothetical protein
MFQSSRVPNILLLTLSLSVSGCGGAPSYNLFGAYFPAWMFCPLIGIVAALTARVIVGIEGIANELPHPFAVCMALGVILAILVSPFFFEL